MARDLYGRSLSVREAPQLWECVRSAALIAEVKEPDYIVVGLSPSFYATELPIHTPAGQVTGRSLYLPLPVLRILTRTEALAFIGHELGHFKYGHTTPGRPYEEEFQLDADRIGAQVAGAYFMAAALLKCVAFSSYWNPAVRYFFPRRHPLHGTLKNCSAVFAQIVALNGRLAVIRERGGGQSDVNTRLPSLGFSVAQVEATALDVRPRESAASLVCDVESVEESFDAAQVLSSIQIFARRPELPLFLPEHTCLRCGAGTLPAANYCSQCGEGILYARNPPSPSELIRLEPLPEEGMYLDGALEHARHQFIREALQRTNGNKTAAARLLGLRRHRLVRALQRLEAYYLQPVELSPSP